MGIFSNKRSLGGTPVSEQSDAAIRRKVNRGLEFGESAATMAKYCMEAEKRGIAWKQSDRMLDKKKKK